MFDLVGFKCQNYQEFSEKLQRLDKDLENGNMSKEGFCRISEFIENNKDLFLGNQRTAILLDSIGTKLCRVDTEDPLINTLQKHIERLLPTNREQVKVSLQFFRNTITDPSQRLKSIVDWISVMKIPLAKLDLTEEELADLLVRLEHIDLTNYNFKRHDLDLFTKILLKPDLKFKTRDTSVLGAIARLCAKQNRHTALHFKSFEINDPVLRFEIARLCAENSGTDTAEYIKNFEIVDVSNRMQIARLCAKNVGEDTGRFIKNFEFANQDFLIEIARVCVVSSAGNVAQYINNFEIVDPAERMKIACLCADRSSLYTAKYIKNFEILEQIDRTKIACLCAMKDTDEMLHFIKNFEIYDPVLRADIARFCAVHGFGTAAFIKDLEIVNSETLIEIAQICAKKYPASTAEFIKNFEIADPAIRFQIACLCAKNDGKATAEYIKNFDIVDQSNLMEIARLCAQNNARGRGAAEFIKNFGIADQSNLMEIAGLCAKNDGKATAEFIKNFGIADQSNLMEIAGLCAKNDGKATAEFIKNFGIADQSNLMEIARLCAQNRGGGTAEFIKNFGIMDPSNLMEIARLCAQSNGKYTAKYIQNFGIVDPSNFMEIARLCAQSNGKYTAKYIQNFGIVDSSNLMEIARLCAKNSGSGTAEYIKNFEIVDPSNLMEIARLCAKNSGSGTAEYIKNFEIGDPSNLMEIARLCAQQDGSGTAESFKNFDIFNHQDKLEMFNLCAISDPESLFLMDNFSSLPIELMKFPRLIQILKSKEAEQSLRGELFNVIDQLILKLSLSENCQQTLMKTSKEMRALSPHVQNVAGLWFLASILGMRSLKSDAVEWMIEQRVWRELALLRDPNLRILLTRGLYELSGDEDKRKPWQAFFSSVQRSEGQRGLMLLAIPFFGLQKAEVKDERLMEIASYLAVCQKENISPLRSVYHIKNILHTLQALVSNNVFTLEMKKAAFEKIFSSLDEKTIIKNIIAAKGLLQLKDQCWPTSSEDLSVLFRDSLEKVIPMQDCKVNVSEKYEEIFASCRNPGGLLTYAAGLKTLGESEVMNCLGSYVVSVLEGTFKEKRYETERNNPHLAKIVESNPNLLKAWKEDLSFDFEDLTSSGTTAIVFNPEEWLEMKLIQDRHLGDTKLIFVNRYLDKEADKKVIFQELLVAHTNLVKKDKEKKQLGKDIDKLKTKFNSLGGDSLKVGEKEIATMTQTYNDLNEQVSLPLAQLNFEKACLNFIQKGQGAEKTILINLLMEIDKALEQGPFARSEFTMDVKGLIEGFEEELKSKSKTKEGLKIVFTDDPIDLLLCGTDVSGSCQRLDGIRDLNRGLLGYLVDGKNRLLAIKEGNKIVARCILSVLWDGEKPVIYRERFYPYTTPENYKNALNALAKKVATKLNVPLTSNDAGASYGKNLVALGGPSPYEYSDGGGGVKKNGLYTIKHAKLIGF